MAYLDRLTATYSRGTVTGTAHHADQRHGLFTACRQRKASVAPAFVVAITGSLAPL